MARASTPTLLSLDRWASIFGVNPVHFNGGDGNSINVFPIISNCNDFWPQYAWQYNDRLSREELAQAIYSAEEDLARVLGYYPAPKWIAQEVHRFDQHYRRDMWGVGGTNVRGARKSITLKYGKFIQAGQREPFYVGTADSTLPIPTLVYSDPDSDGFDELATIVLPTTLTNECELKAYFAGHDGDPEWEIRPALSRSADGVNVTLTFNSWMLFDPDQWERYPPYTAGSTTLFDSIDINDADSYVTTVDVYREYTDSTAASATFYWEPEPQGVAGCTSCGGGGCAACSLQSQDGCLHVRSTEGGVAVPVPAEYDEDNAQWNQVAYTVCRDPNEVKCSYYAGQLGDRWLSGDVCDQLGDFWARTIAEVAMARLTKPPCSCAHVRAQYEELRVDLARVGRESSYIFDPNLLSNPLGTRQGEINAWRRVDGVAVRRLGGGAI